MMIIDAHQDVAHNAIDWDRDLTRPIREIREARMIPFEFDWFANQ